MKYLIKPYFYTRQPDTFLLKRQEISRIQLWPDGRVEIPELGENEVIYFDKYDDDCYLVVYRETKTPNPNYEQELVAYNKAKADYDVRLVEYHKEINEFHQAQLEEKTKREKAEFERLKKIYG